MNGNGKDPGIKDILRAAEKAGLPKNAAQKTAERIREIVQDELREYLKKRA